MFGCERLWVPPGPKFSFNLTWNIPSYILDNDAIRNFTVTGEKDNSQISTSFQIQVREELHSLLIVYSQ